MYKIADTAAPLEFFRKNGFYVVGNEIYNHKVNALEAASRTGQDVHWNFNNEFFESIDWKTPIHTDIRDLYKMRAQQLRDKYDHLVLLYSGGADSTTILKAFLDNNIHLDEIIYDGPFTHLLGKHKVSNDPDPANLISEWDFSAKPTLEYVSKNFPKTKITLIDGLDKLTPEDYEDTCTLVLAHNYVIIKRHRKIEDRLREISDKITKNFAVLPGIDKPHTVVDYNVLCAIFDDNRCFLKSDYADGYERCVEYFYWTPDFPEIVVKQNQLIYQSIQSRPNIRYFFDSALTTKEQRMGIPYRSAKRDLLSEIVYPTWNIKTFQAIKSDSVVNSAHYQWATDLDDPTIDSWRSSVNTRLNIINNKYLERKGDGSLLTYRPLYPRRVYPVGLLPKL